MPNIKRVNAQSNPPKSNFSNNNAPVDHFPLKNEKSRRWFLLLGSIIVILFAILSIIDQILALRLGTQIYGRSVVLSQAPLLLFLIFLALPAGVIGILYTKNHWNDGITIFGEGFRQKRGRNHVEWHWQDTTCLDTRISHIMFGGGEISTRVFIRLEDQDGKELIIRNRYNRIDDLTSIIRSQILPVLLVNARLSFVQNYDLNFGNSLKASALGLFTKKDFFPWSDIETHVIKNERIILNSKQKKFFQTKIQNIRNLDLLIHLIKYPPATS